MKNLIFLLMFFAVSKITYAGVCNNGSLSGYYSYNGMEVYYGDSYHSVGRIYFNGAGSVSFSGIDSALGVASARSGSGTYTVSSNCVATGTLTLNNARKLTFWLYLDTMDTVPLTNLAYHAAAITKNNYGDSGSGEITRVNGKF